MARIKRSLNAKKKRRRTLKMAKGYFGARSHCYRKAKEQVRHSLMYQYRDRRTKKREIRKLWIARINAGCRINGISYSQFMHGLKLAGIELNRKVLADLAVYQKDDFAKVVDLAKAALK